VEEAGVEEAGAKEVGAKEGTTARRRCGAWPPRRSSRPPGAWSSGVSPAESVTATMASHGWPATLYA
jgi:hypothetical protein